MIKEIVSLTAFEKISALGCLITTKSNITWSVPYKEDFYRVSLNSDQPYWRRIKKCLSQSEVLIAILDVRSLRKVTTLSHHLTRNISTKFHQILTNHIGEEVLKVSANQRFWWPYWMSDRYEK